MRQAVFTTLILTLATMMLAACGGGGGGGTSVDVDLKEWSVVPASTTIKSGAVTFQAKNSGTRNHELRISRLGGSSPQPVGIIETFPAGQTKSKQFTLTPGQYELSCQLAEQEGGQIINHYALGMKTNITVE